ncbi:MAG: glutathione peroxidase [Geminicoccaceae bacterium]
MRTRTQHLSPMALAVALIAFAGTMIAAIPARAGDILAHTLTAIEGGPLPLEQYRGRPLLIVNTASFCGYTPQYRALQDLWESYRDRDLVILGVPSNNFGNQEPGSNSEIKEFCEVNFAIDFPMSEKVEVKGSASHPLFVELREQLGADAGPDWNFFKYLVDREGKAVAFWPSRVRPDDDAIQTAIEAALAPAG